jgi:hypothetical protein
MYIIHTLSTRGERRCINELSRADQTLVPWICIHKTPARRCDTGIAERCESDNVGQKGPMTTSRAQGDEFLQAEVTGAFVSAESAGGNTFV